MKCYLIDFFKIIIVGGTSGFRNNKFPKWPPIPLSTHKQRRCYNGLQSKLPMYQIN
jgi:hypothetical protein